MSHVWSDLRLVAAAVLLPASALVVGTALAEAQGHRWQLGFLGMPEPVVVAGRYTSGEPVDPINLALLQAGWYQPVLFAVITFPVVLSFVLLWTARRQRRRHAAELARIRSETARLRALVNPPPPGLPTEVIP